jgi:hypothetical protein
LIATAVGSQVNLAWIGGAGASGYNLKRATITGGAYTTIAANLAGLSYADTGVTAGATYYYVVSGTNFLGESGNSSEASARTVSTTSPQMNFAAATGQMQLSWPMDHLGWRLEMQTNSLATGTGWVTVPNSAATNQVFVPINPTNGSVFFRLVYP